jgi:hypothetical protein
MTKLSENFLANFCEIGPVCYHGEPNWIGWIILALFIYGFVWLFLKLVSAAWS